MNKTPLALCLLLCGGDTPMTLVDYPGRCTKQKDLIDCVLTQKEQSQQLAGKNVEIAANDTKITAKEYYGGCSKGYGDCSKGY